MLCLPHVGAGFRSSIQGAGEEVGHAGRWDVGEEAGTETPLLWHTTWIDTPHVHAASAHQGDHLVEGNDSGGQDVLPNDGVGRRPQTGHKRGAILIS